MKPWILSLLGWLALLTSPVSAAVPTFLPVQGYLTDADGVPVDGETTLNFSLYDEANGVSPVWTETQLFTVRQGHLHGYLGMIFPISAQLFADSQDLWLGVVVGSDPEMPRIRLGAIPFAAYAERCGAAPAHAHVAADVTGVATSAQSCQVGEVVTGIDAAGHLVCSDPPGPAPPDGGGGGGGGAYALAGQSCPFGQFVTGFTATGAVICAPPASGGGGAGDGGIQGSGTNKRLAVFSSSDTLKASIVTESSNKIGINTTSPGRTLEVKGDLEVTGDFYWGGEKFSTSSCVVMGGTSCSSACSKHGMSCSKAFAIEGDNLGSTSCSQSGYKFCCCKN